jgi:pyoverdine/dityrosine biosynthesis protein Dit1
MEEELRPRGFTSGNQLTKAAKSLTREMMLRNEAYSNLVKKEFSSMVRLSMHPSVNNGAKYSFQLIPSPKAHHSAWHCALVVNNDGSLETMHRKDADALGYELVSVDNRPYYYKSNL